MPHKCPICEGRGKLKGFYPDANPDEWVNCRGCYGTGVVQEGVIRISPSPYPVPMPYPVPQPYPVYPPYRFWYSDVPGLTWGTVTISSGSQPVVYGDANPSSLSISSGVN